MPKEIRFLGLDIETQRKGSDWGEGRFKFKNFLCGDMMFQDEGVHMFSGFFPKAKAFESWVLPMREPNIIVVAHNAKYDLQGVNGWLARLGLEPLGPTRYCDTLHDGPTRGGMAHGTLASMAKQYGVTPKGAMDSFDWDRAYLNDAGYRDLVEEYNKNDVEVVLQLRSAMFRQGHLTKPPKIWRGR